MNIIFCHCPLPLATPYPHVLFSYRKPHALCYTRCFAWYLEYPSQLSCISFLANSNCSSRGQCSILSPTFPDPVESRLGMPLVCRTPNSASLHPDAITPVLCSLTPGLPPSQNEIHENRVYCGSSWKTDTDTAGI